jgi:LysR family transcriptional regulator, glycine cleavage system transcriptional activator
MNAIVGQRPCSDKRYYFVAGLKRSHLSEAAMVKRLPSLSALRAFEAAARRRSFKLAAEELAVTPTAISHGIRALERELRTPLFVRKTRAVELTAEGLALMTAVREGFDAIAAGVALLDRRKRQSVRVSTTPAFAAKWLVPRLAQLHAEYPTIDLHVHASYEPVDLQASEVDMAIRYGLGRYMGLVSTLLMHDHFAPVASPGLHIKHAKDISAHRRIHFDWQQPLPVDLTWSAWFKKARTKQTAPDSDVHYSEESHAIQAAVAGQGVALLSLVLVQDELQLGVLEAPVGPTLDGLSYHLVRSAQRPHSEAASTVEAWLLKAAKSGRPDRS